MGPLDVLIAEDLLQRPHDKHFLRFAVAGSAARGRGGGRGGHRSRAAAAAGRRRRSARG